MTAASGSSRPTSPAGRGTRTPGTPARRRRCSRGPSSGCCPSHRLARISVELGRPVPMAGFRIAAEVVRAGRATANTPGRHRRRGRRGTGLGDRHARRRQPGAAVRRQRSATRTAYPRLADAEPGDFPIGPFAHGLPGFRDARDGALPTRRGQRPSGRRRCGCARIPLLPGRGDVTVPAHLPVGRLRQRLQPPRRPRPGAVRQHRPRRSRCTAIPSASGWAAGSTSHWQPTGVGLGRRPAVRRRGRRRAGAADPAAAARRMSDPLRARARRGRRGRARPDRPRRHGLVRRRLDRALPRRALGSSSGPVTTRRWPRSCGAAPRPARRSCPRAATPGSSAAACRGGGRWSSCRRRRLDDLGPVDAGAMQVTAGAGVTLAQWRAHARGGRPRCPGRLRQPRLGDRRRRRRHQRRRIAGRPLRHDARPGGRRHAPCSPTARCVGSLAGLPKETLGLHWPSLLCGSEGTLGVLTALRLRVVPWYRRTATAMVATAGTRRGGRRARRPARRGDPPRRRRADPAGGDGARRRPPRRRRRPSVRTGPGRTSSSSAPTTRTRPTS